MLRITLKPGEDLLIGGNVVVRVIASRRGRRYEIGIEAPREIVVLRGSVAARRADGGSNDGEENACNPPADL